MLIKGLLVFFATNLFLFAGNMQCNLDDEIMGIIATIEAHPSKAPGYPYLISFNNKKEAIEFKKEIGDKIFLDNRTIDCKNYKLCKDIANYLVKVKKITNLDLGAFQINYKFHKMDMQNYFSFEDSYFKACGIIEKLIKRYGYNWRTIAMYHSATPKFNYHYLKKIAKITKNEE